MLDTDQTPGWSAERAALWTGVFFVNLPVPMLLGLVVTSNKGGATGMFAAVTAVFSAGLVLCGCFPRLGQVLIRGAGAVALLQTVPLLQVGAGVLAIAAWEYAFGWPDNSLATEATVFGMTLSTAMPLLLAALVFGGGHRLILGGGAREVEVVETQAE